MVVCHGLRCVLCGGVQRVEVSCVVVFHGLSCVLCGGVPRVEVCLVWWCAKG